MIASSGKGKTSGLQIDLQGVEKLANFWPWPYSVLGWVLEVDISLSKKEMDKILE